MGPKYPTSLTKQVMFQLGYNGQQNYHVFSRTYVNVINPVTGKRPLPDLDQIDVRGEDGVSSFHVFCQHARPLTKE